MLFNSQHPRGDCSRSNLKSRQTAVVLTFRTSDDLLPIPSSYGQKGWWVGKPSAAASRVNCQSCCLWGKVSTAVETPWCQWDARHPRRSLIGLATLRMADTRGGVFARRKINASWHITGLNWDCGKCQHRKSGVAAPECERVLEFRLATAKARLTRRVCVLPQKRKQGIKHNLYYTTLNRNGRWFYKALMWRRRLTQKCCWVSHQAINNQHVFDVAGIDHERLEQTVTHFAIII